MEYIYTEVGFYKDTNGEDIEFHYRKRISYSEVVNLINKINNSCFNKNGEYDGFAYEFALLQGIILLYTDISLSKNADEIYEFIYSNKLDEIFLTGYNEVSRCKHITILDLRQINFIQEESWKLVEFHKEQLLHKSSLDSLLDACTEFINKMTTQFTGLKMEDIKGISQFGEQFKNFDQNEFMQKVIEFAKKDN